MKVMNHIERISNLEINQILRDRASPLYEGIYSIDNIPFEYLNQKKHFIVVCNLARQGNYGTHFIVIVYDDGHMFYLDSLAPPQEFVNLIFLRFRPTKVSFLKRPLQSTYSHACGYYCIFFVLYFDRIMTNREVDFILPFSLTNPLINDSICMSNLSMLENIYETE